MTVPSVLIIFSQSEPGYENVSLWHSLPADWIASRINEVLFPKLGVLTPLVEVRVDEGATGRSTVSLNEGELGPIDLNRAPESIADLLGRRASELVTVPLVEFYLSRLQPRYPALVKAIVRQFSTADIAATLGGKLDRGESIKHLVGVLEEMLTAAARSTAAGPSLPRTVAAS